MSLPFLFIGAGNMGAEKKKEKEELMIGKNIAALVVDASHVVRKEVS